MRQECGIAGTGPSTTVGQTGELKRLCDWISQAYIEIQSEESNWEFLRKTIRFDTQYGTTKTDGMALQTNCVYRIVTRTTLDFDTVGVLYSGVSNTSGATYLITSAATLGAGDETLLIGKQFYSLADIGISTDFAAWRNESFRCYLKSAGIATQIILSQYFNFSDFRDFYLLGSRNLVTGRPLYISIAPDKSLAFGFTPNDIYATTAEYYSVPQILSADADVPLMPARFHMAIVYKAMMSYGYFMSAQEQLERGKAGYAPLYARLQIDQTPMIMGGASFI